jgi:hypothetical protein
MQSSLLNAATYQDQNAFLELEFRSGAIYRYLAVPTQMFQQLLRAESKGGYFNQHIRNRYAFIKIAHAHSGVRFRPDSGC